MTPCQRDYDVALLLKGVGNHSLYKLPGHSPLEYHIQFRLFHCQKHVKKVLRSAAEFFKKV